MSSNPRLHLPVIQEALFKRPRTVGDCRRGIRPCPFVSCRFNLLIDVLPDGSLLLNAKYPSMRFGAGRVIPPKIEVEARAQDEIEDMIEAVFDEPSPPVRSCLLDETMHRRRDDAELDDIADVLFVSRERVRQIEASGLENLKDRLREDGVDAEAIGVLEDILDRGGR